MPFDYSEDWFNCQRLLCEDDVTLEKFVINIALFVDFVQGISHKVDPIILDLW
ncbi:unnamed protein product [Haemonchus placei]|uniref:Uncharacterized protein n=1 Tax=Haemonchus placei TaxID=6290 RepID=A0A0N4WZC9_HAEPC|nr:unnamed protein product [Haemonchus placei]